MLVSQNVHVDLVLGGPFWKLMGPANFNRGTNIYRAFVKFPAWGVVTLLTPYDKWHQNNLIEDKTNDLGNEKVV